MHLGRPGSLGRLGRDGILRGHRVDGVRDPGVPERLDLRGVVIVFGEVNPARAQREFFLVLEELVAELVDAYKGAGFGVAYEDGTFKPTLRRLRIVLVMVDMVVGVAATRRLATDAVDRGDPLQLAKNCNGMKLWPMTYVPSMYISSLLPNAPARAWKAGHGEVVVTPHNLTPSRQQAVIPRLQWIGPGSRRLHCTGGAVR
ncbi:hypothetical protein NEUTE1DRAFT_120046 [Neurospora tetrasperma FGSC 2508]|uniref:Uncharacterized protein n=1 Tax=Neurospora tetrasperma (strain FGSC 2508 / ATCC MYA-4615 / P0657) TaxID=510951 RepID=F8MF87_NEUT8|nr:uncharacterized protein NEUTE1DRAFT_120046 [Neurospora tetrasperma FGSC 2508]EGO60941.1 hypothetical protein NEUTE1DRAFT_120046 [Neurospora tetrasperma FGSC 2508]